MRGWARRGRRSLSTAVFVVTMTAGTAVSQELQIGAHLGVAVPVGDFYVPPVALNTGNVLGVVINLNSTRRPFGVAVSLNYSSLRAEVDSLGYAETWAIAGSLVWWPGAIGRRVRPYLQAGAGADYWQTRPNNSIAVGLDGGVGATVDVGGSWVPYLETRYHVTLTDGSNLRQVLVVGGLRFRL